ncbi:hypothetical protein I6F30_33350 [Bradyrhizobium sp. NBAIM20]|uniref:hypothetical protein n=1 Tax=unclassified Bradyrhizobium TaxID=2631580 RepID=UPI001CD604B8|nr:MULTISPECIES: hypothetical protein [unclassified Bradyrhizobium]MCA1415975.1 hypothetical protein [Bradyrhizobium sp. NBAIM20]MCA1464027.1 hypothetical protein [Bradyrhizobium sp. NBAIM18]
MRRVRDIVNEMDFRMLREGKSFLSICACGSDERIFADAGARKVKRDSIACCIPVQLRPRTRRILESSAPLKRHCLKHVQYGCPFH